MFDYVCPPKTADELEALASSVRAKFQFIRPPIPIIDILEFGYEHTEREIQIEVCQTSEMINIEGATSGEQSVIKLREDVYVRAWEADQRSRFTVAHELGHFLLQKNTKGLKRVRGRHPIDLESAEWQADYFAAAMLMPRHNFPKTANVAKIRGIYNVSYRAALRRKHELSSRLTNEIQLDMPLCL